VRALVTGATGQLGVELLRTAPGEVDVVGVAHAQCDIADAAEVDAAIRSHRPDIVINAAAFTPVDKAESVPELAFSVNAIGAGNVARAAERGGARVVHISTDYVFDGTAREPYKPGTLPHPINVYGRSKLAGEQEVGRASSNSLIVRTGWLYAGHGKNFFRTILAALQSSKSLRVVNDQIGVPTAARSLAMIIWDCAVRSDLRGVQHWVDGDSASWYDFALSIQQIAVERNLLCETRQIVPITSDEYRAAASRPPFSVLDARDLSLAIGRKQRPWRSWLAEVFDEISEEPVAPRRRN
jgi:dTDP-4-dehydrorhamnose reductase